MLAAARRGLALTRRPDRRLEVGVSAVVVLPVLAAAARALAEGWIPMGENAIMPLRARDVLTADHPWLGTFSSASLTSDTVVNHPGPLLFDVLALPVRLFGSAAGTALGVAAIAAVALAVALRAAHAAGGRRWFVAVAVAAVALEWTLGSSLLIDPWNPHVLVLPWFATLVSAAALVCGWRPGLAWVVVLGSFAIQTHVSYALQVPLLLAAAIALGVVARRMRAGCGAWDLRGGLDRWRRPAVVAAAWGLLLWAQPLWQQVAGHGPGNLTALARSAREEQARAGFDVAVRLVARVVVLPPWWARSSFSDSLADLPLRGADGGALQLAGWVPGRAAAVAGMSLVALALVAVVAAGRRRGDRAVVAPAAVALVALPLAVWSASSIPAGGYGVAPHQLRWLWPLAVLWMAAVGHGIVATLSGAHRWTSDERSLEGGRSVLRAAPIVALSALAIHACVGYDQPVGVARAPGSRASVEEIAAEVGAARFPDAVLDNGGMWIGEPYTAPILERVYRDDVVRVAVDEVQAAQVGHRRLVTDDVAARLHMRWGAAALVCPADGSRRIALSTTLGADVTGDVERGAAEVGRILTTVSLVADEASLAEAPDLADALGDPAAEQALVLSGRFAEIVRTTAVGTWLAPDEREAVDRFDAARASAGIETVAVFVGPRAPGEVWGPGDPVAATVVPGAVADACPEPT